MCKGRIVNGCRSTQMQTEIGPKMTNEQDSEPELSKGK